MNSGLDIFGVDELPKKRAWTWGRGMLALTSGAIAALVTKKHPVLAFLGTAALVSNAHAVAAGDRTWQHAVKKMGRHVVATAASLSVPKYPGTAYVAGAVAADMFIDGEGGGIIEEWADYEGIRDKSDVIDAEFTEVKPKALVKVT